MAASDFSFFGLEVQASKPHTFIPNENTVLHLTNVAIDPSAKGSQRATLYVKTESSEKKAVICTLVAEKLPQTPVDLLFPGGVEITLSVEGGCNVHICGWSQPLDEEIDEQDFDDEDIDSDEEAADMAELKAAMRAQKRRITADDSDDQDEDDEDDEDEDEDEDEDDDEEMDDEDDEDDDLMNALVDDVDDDDEVPVKKQSEQVKKVEAKPQPQKPEQQKQQQQQKPVESKQQQKPEQQKQQKPEQQKQQKPEQPKQQQPVKQAEKPAEPAQKKAKTESSKPQTLPGGLQYVDDEIGQGPTVQAGRRVSVYYTGRLTNNKIFDSNAGKKPFSFSLGRGEVIKGWDAGVEGMKVGGKRRLVIPAKMGYGSSGAPPTIPPNATLLFEVEVLSMK